MQLGDPFKVVTQFYKDRFSSRKRDGVLDSINLISSEDSASPEKVVGESVSHTEHAKKCNTEDGDKKEGSAEMVDENDHDDVQEYLHTGEVVQRLMEANI